MNLNPIPPNHSTPLDDAALSLVPFTTRQCGPKGEEVPFCLSDLSFDANLDLDGNTRVVPLPQAPQGTHTRNVKRVRHPPQCHIWPGTIPQLTPQTTSSHPQVTQFGTLPTTVTPQPTFGTFDGAHALSLHPSLSPTHPGDSSSALLDGGTPQVQVWQGAIPQVRHKAKTSSLTGSTNPQLNFHPPVDYQLAFDTFDDAYSLLPQLSSSLLSNSSSAIECSSGERAAPLSSTQDITFHMTSGPAPVQPSLTPMVPISGSPFRVNASIPIVPMGSAPAAATATVTTDFARGETRQVPISRGLCPGCMRPLVRVDNTIEWVRPDVMKMVLYFNFSSDAEAEAHSSWEPHGA